MLTAITLTLTASADATLPPFLGRANHAAVLQQLGAIDPALMRAIHDGAGPKPLTCSDLIGAESDRNGVHVKANQRYLLRTTGLTPAVSEGLLTALAETPPTSWSLANQAFVVTQVCCDAAQDPRSGQTTYEALAANQLLDGGKLARKVSLIFHSPTSFQSKGMHVPVPLPNLVFGSLVDRWNAFSPVTLSPEIRRFGEEMVALSNYRLQSIPVIQKNGAPLIGGVGRATYTALGGDRYWLATMEMLADFAFYSGVGVKTTIGLGQVSRLKGK